MPAAQRPPAVHRVLGEPPLAALRDEVHPAVLRAAAARAVQRVRDGELEPDPLTVATAAAGTLAVGAPGTREVLNATGVLLHTNLGRAAWPDRSVAAAAAAAGTTDVEWDPVTGQRGTRGEATRQALLDRVPEAGGACVVTNGAAALLLSLRAVAGDRPVLVSRGELVEIGDGFRIPDLLRAGGVRLVEVGATNRTHWSDYADALATAADGGDPAGAVLKVHRSNFVVSGFTSEVDVAELARRLGDVPLVVDAGSGLLDAHPLLPREPAARDLLAAGADLVTCSGDKLLGGPQAGLVLGRADLAHAVRRHPLYRAVRPDKTLLAALWGALTSASTPATRGLEVAPGSLRARAESLAKDVAESLRDNGYDDPQVVPHVGRVGGGCAPEVELAGWAVRLPAALAVPLRLGAPAVAGRVEDDALLLDPRAVDPADDERLAAAVRSAVATTPATP